MDKETIIRDQRHRLLDLESDNKKLREALEKLRLVGHYGQMQTIIKNALQETSGEDRGE